MILLINVVAMLLKHRDRSSARGAIRRSVVLSCPVPEVPRMLRHIFVLQSETRSCIGVGTTSERVGGRCVGWVQGLSSGTKVGRCQRSWKTTFDSQKWKSNSRGMIFFDSLRETDEHTYFDLSPGVSRDPQYGRPSTSNDVPMTPVPVPDETMPDTIADEPDTSGIPVLPNYVCTSAQSTSALAFMFWNILRHSLFLHLLCLRKLFLQPHHHGLHLCQSPVKRRRCNNHGSIRNQKQRGFLPSKIHQRPFHSKCRCHPCRFLRHGRRRTCPLVTQLFRPRLGSMKLHSRRQQFMKMFYHWSLRLTRLHL